MLHFYDGLDLPNLNRRKERVAVSYSNAWNFPSGFPRTEPGLIGAHQNAGGMQLE